MMQGALDWRFMAAFALVLVIGGYLISLHNVNHAWTGALVLIFAFVADAGYSAWMKWGGKKEDADNKSENPTESVCLFGGLACDVALIALLVYGISGDM